MEEAQLKWEQGKQTDAINVLKKRVEADYPEMAEFCKRRPGGPSEPIKTVVGSQGIFPQCTSRQVQLKPDFQRLGVPKYLL